MDQTTPFENRFINWIALSPFKVLIRSIFYKIAPYFYYLFFSKNLIFSNAWADPHLSKWNEILNRLNYSNNNKIRYLEIGCFEGRSLLWMLNNILGHKKSSATVIDVLGPSYCFKLFNNLVASGHARKVKLKPGLSRNILPKMTENTFDIIYIDGSHSMADTISDIIYSWRLLKVNGVMIIDDYLLGDDILPVDLRPKLAIDTFLIAFGEYLEVEHHAEQVFFKKISETKQTGEILFDLGDSKYDWYRKTLRWQNKTPVLLKHEDIKALDNYLKKIPMSYKKNQPNLPENILNLLNTYKDH